MAFEATKCPMPALRFRFPIFEIHEVIKCILSTSLKKVCSKHSTPKLKQLSSARLFVYAPSALLALTSGYQGYLFIQPPSWYWKHKSAPQSWGGPREAKDANYLYCISWLSPYVSISSKAWLFLVHRKTTKADFLSWAWVLKVANSVTQLDICVQAARCKENFYTFSALQTAKKTLWWLKAFPKAYFVNWDGLSQKGLGTK